VYDRLGGPEVLVVTEVPRVHPGPGEVRVRVRATGINRFGSKLRTGRPPYSSDVPFPRGVGQGFAGVIDGVGPRAHLDGSPVQVGDEVVGFADGMCVREQLAVVGTASPATTTSSAGWHSFRFVTAKGSPNGYARLVSKSLQPWTATAGRSSTPRSPSACPRAGS
jgi:NADPH:quinone reductase-like Zn-dependent oxidoreductase